MPIDSIKAQVSALLLRTTPAQLPWAIGELLSAKVIGAASENSTRLRVGGQTITARSAIALHPGQELELRVAARDPMIVLRVESAVPPAAVAVERGLARSLPRQGSAAETLHLLRTLVRHSPTPTTTSNAVSASSALEVHNAASALLRAVPERTALLEPSHLRRAIERSATPPEALLQQSAALRHSPGEALALPRALHQLAAALNTAAGLANGARARVVPATVASHSPYPDTRPVSATAPKAAPVIMDPLPVTDGIEPPIELPRLRELVDGALARLQSHQLQNALQPALPGTPLLAELPVRDGDRIDLWRFELVPEHSRADNRCTGDSGVSITLRMLLGGAESFDACLTLRNGALHVQLGSHDPAVAATIGLHLNQFEQRMRSRGIALASLLVATVPHPPNRPPLQRNLVDQSI